MLGLLVAIKALILIAPLQFLMRNHEVSKSHATFAMLVTELLILIFMMMLKGGFIFPIVHLDILHVAVHRHSELFFLDHIEWASQIKNRTKSYGKCQSRSLKFLDFCQCFSFFSTLLLTALIIYHYAKLYIFKSGNIERYPKANFQFTLLISFTLLFLQGCSERFLSIQTPNLYDSNHINSEFNLHSPHILHASLLSCCFRADKRKKFDSNSEKLPEFKRKIRTYYSLAMLQLKLSLLCLILHYLFLIMCIYLIWEEDWSQHNSFMIFILWPFQFMERGSTSSSMPTIHPHMAHIYFSLFFILLAYFASA
ncbi:MAG: hypothetical protein MHMPM18_002783, partial [Marteilia pararefringens]